MAEGMMDLLADIRRRGVIEGLRRAEEIAQRVLTGDTPTASEAHDIRDLIRAEREKLEGNNELS